jgi:hypothetical protein
MFLIRTILWVTVMALLVPQEPAQQTLIPHSPAGIACAAESLACEGPVNLLERLRAEAMVRITTLKHRLDVARLERDNNDGA